MVTFEIRAIICLIDKALMIRLALWPDKFLERDKILK